MNITLPDQTSALVGAVESWAKTAGRLSQPSFSQVGANGAIADPGAAERWRALKQPVWRELVGLGVLEVENSGGSLLDTVAAFMALGPSGLPGPVLESYLAMVSGNKEASRILESGGLVTSVKRAGSRVLVGWGAVADTAIDQVTGEILASGPLPWASMSYRGFPHGWLEIDETGVGLRDPAFDDRDGLLLRRWTAGAALIVGLSEEALRRTTSYANDRVQFGKPISSFQSVQSYLVECYAWLRATRMAVYDAAWRTAENKSYAEPAAAIAWLAATRLGKIVESNCHQVYGATGFTEETGLLDFTWPIWWLRSSVGTKEASALLRASRCRTPGNVASRVFDNY